MATLSIIAGVVLLIILSKKRRRPARTVTTRTVKTVYTLGTKKTADAEKARKEQFNRMQAAADLDHYKQVKTDLLKAYESSGAIYGDSEKAIRKRIQYDNALRKAEKQIEKAAYNARRPGI